MKTLPVLLIILDGFGCRAERADNAIAQASKPNWDRLWKHHPHTLIHASESEVGLPKGQMGNSEVGHLNIGAGRVAYQSMTRINKSIRDGDFYVLNGKKRFITNGKYANLHLVIALTNPGRGKKGLSCILVPSSTPGFSVSKTMNPMGQRCSDNAELEFSNCSVPAANLVGRENHGLGIVLRAFDGGRFSVAAIALGCAQAAFEKALRYAQKRVQFGQAIIGFQSIEFMLAEMGTQIEAARLMIHRAASFKDRGLPYTKESSMAKMFATEVAETVCHHAIQIMGGAGYMRENDVERYYRDQRVCQIYEGTNQIQRWIVAIQLIKEFGAR